MSRSTIVEDAAARQSFWARTVVSLRYRDFRLLWLGSVAEHVGEFMEIAAMLWMVHQLTRSPLMLTIVGSARFAPMVLFPIIGGVVADRMDRRRLLIATLLGSGFLSLCLSLLTLAGLAEVWFLILICLLSGVAMSFNHPARQAILPNLVKKEHLLNAVSMDFFSVQGARLVGMAAAGYLIAALGPWSIFLLRAVGCALAVFWLELAQVPPTPISSQGKTSRQNLLEGFRFLRSNAAVLILVVLYLTPWLAGNTFATFLPVFCSDILNIGAVGYGHLQAASGFGSLLAMIGLTPFTHYKKKPKLMVGSLFLMGLCLIAFSVSVWPVVSYLLLVVVGAMQMAFTAVNTALLQWILPDQFRGRVQSWREVAFGLGMTGSIVLGAIAQWTGVQISLGILAAFVLVVSLLLIGLLPRMDEHQA
jgi:MFS transporter, DHA1 family, staphyloferrin A biosynthesis exporter